ncbi:excalibur calcium-binding domain-containing protein [Streptomyces sp. NBC_00237]|nr:excalibur calcium-binding domain-containing protein [Streptomyces sp. NBC_00237]
MGGARQRAVTAGGVVVVAAVTLAGCGGGTPVDAKPVGGASTPTAAEPSATEAAPTPTPAGGVLGLIDDTARVKSVKAVVVDVLANDTFKAPGGGDAEAFKKAVQKGEFTLALEAQPTAGTAVVSAGGSSFTYTPQVGYGGADEFTYKVTVEGVSGTAVVRLTVSAPKPPPVKTKKPAPPVRYKNCAAVRAAGAAPINEGDPGYARHLDRDGDGVGCEPYEGGTGGTGGGSGSGGSSTSGGSGGGNASYKNCSAVRAAGAAPIRRGDPGYGRHLDRDGDGVGCE